MSQEDFILFHRGEHFLNQTNFVVFGKPQLLEDSTYFIPIQWKNINEQPMYRKIFFDTDRIQCSNSYFQTETNLILETEFQKHENELFYFFQNLEEYLIEQITNHSSDWFHNRISRSQIEDYFRPIVIMSRRTHNPIIRWNIPCIQGTPTIDFINQFRKPVFPYQLNPGMDIDIRFQLMGFQFTQYFCSIILSVQQVRLFTNRKTSTQQPFLIHPKILKKQVAELEFQPELQPELQPESQIEQSESQPESQPESQIEQPELQIEQPELQPESQIEQPELQPESQPKLESEFQPESQIKTQPKTKKIKRILKTSNGQRIWTLNRF